MQFSEIALSVTDWSELFKTLAKREGLTTLCLDKNPFEKEPYKQLVMLLHK